MKNFFLKTAYLLGKESKCVSKQVGAIIVHENRIVATGYNGTPSGHINCNEMFDKNNFDREKHHDFSLREEIHAEANSISFSARHGILTEGATMYCTLEPCNDCLKLLLAAGIKKIYYMLDYEYSDRKNPLRKMIHIEKICNKELEKFMKENKKL